MRRSPCFRASWRQDGSRPDALDSELLLAAHGIWLAPGTPYRNGEAAYAAIEHARMSGTPFLGTCGGFHYVCVSLARSLAGRPNAGHAETDPDSSHIVVAPLACALYGEERPVTPVAGNAASRDLWVGPVRRLPHFCGYGLTPDGENLLAASRVTISAHSADGGVEGIELAEHPFFVATLFQPQVGSSRSRLLHPLDIGVPGGRRWRAPSRAASEDLAWVRLPSDTAPCFEVRTTKRAATDNWRAWDRVGLRAAAPRTDFLVAGLSAAGTPRANVSVHRA